MGLALALLTAFFVSLRKTFEKFAVKEIDEFTVGLGFRFFSFVFLVTFVLLFNIPLEVDNSKIIIPLLIGGTLNVITTIYLLKALKVGELSLIGPLAALTPIFILMSSPFIIGQVPTPVGLIGVLLIMLGTFSLNYKHHHFTESVTSLLNTKNGSLYMLISAIAWGIAASVDKVGLNYTTPFTWAILMNIFVVVVLTVYISFKDIRKVDLFRSEFVIKHLMISGLFAALASIFHYYAIGFMLVVYVVSIKQLSSVFEVFIGHFILKETHFKQRLLCTIIMVLGATLIFISNG